jgi:hypothetical protein
VSLDGRNEMLCDCKKVLLPAKELLNMKVDYLKGSGFMAIYAIIISKTARVISPKIRFLLSISTASPTVVYELYH